MTIKVDQSARAIRVWGDKKKGIFIVRAARKSKGKYSWNIHHVRDGKTVLVHRDFSKAEAIREAKGYAKYEKANPRSGYLR